MAKWSEMWAEAEEKKDRIAFFASLPVSEQRRLAVWFESIVTQPEPIETADVSYTLHTFQAAAK